MLGSVRTAVARRLPEKVVYQLVLARHGETAAQLALRRAAGRPDGRAGAPRRGPRPAVVELFDAHATQRANVDAVSVALTAAGIEHVLVPEPNTGRRRVAVSIEHRVAALAALHTLSGDEWGVSVGRRRAVPAAAAADLAGAQRLRVFRALVAASGEPVAGVELACSLEFWTRVDQPGTPRADGGTYQLGTRLAPAPAGLAAGYLAPDAWTRAVQAPGHWPVEATTLLQVREPIDIVYTWVDGDDRAWQARKAPYEGTAGEHALGRSAAHVSRFASRDELRYSLRSVAAYAGWVRRIFIVTDGQVPGWLDTTHPAIEIVDHTRIFTDPGVLPVFNSHAIESQLHHIPGLAERYLYLNDDVFFGRPVRPELFFHGNGLAKFFLAKHPLDVGPPSPDDRPVVSAAKRNRALLEARFGATVTRRFQHTPHPQLRSVNEQLEREYPEEFAVVARSRFRHPDDVSVAASLHHWFAYGLGRAVPGRLRYVYQDTAAADTPRRLRNLLRTRDADAFCLNELETDPERAAEQRVMLRAFFDRYFPVPSPYELADVSPTVSHGLS